GRRAAHHHAQRAGRHLVEPHLHLHPMMFGGGKAEVIQHRRLREGRRRGGQQKKKRQTMDDRRWPMDDGRWPIDAHCSPATLSTVFTTSDSVAEPMISSVSLMIVFGTPFTPYLRTRSGSSVASMAVA